MSHLTVRHLSTVSLLSLALMACGSASTTGTPPGGSTGGTPGGSMGGSARPNTVSGQVLDQAGRPIQGALIWVLPAVTTGLITLHTDAQGRYVSPALVNVPYRTYAGFQAEYRGQSFCQRLAATSLNEYDAFSPDPTGTIIRNFRWQISGAMPDGRDNYFGAEVRIFHRTWADGQEIVAGDSSVELTLVPDGPLIDGSAGKTVVKSARVGENMLYDIPVGHYAVKATEVHGDGSRTPLLVGDYSGPGSAASTLDFRPQSGSCVGGTSNGVERASVYVARP
ncbi:carboxypeptidase-like regulatory domain-containing protein [uncultured Deinococcus sp.]|uniref:carboxypeptidase-like regulatory domain-containing protein n=1 Tax=uncultured Deinococcus sp. TaxID=158789 RepID=UPI0025CF5B1F|nr:carboxypeptidase-like regulatory domain-containing protein [uncultured Deinococcus sp.]